MQVCTSRFSIPVPVIEVPQKRPFDLGIGTTHRETLCKFNDLNLKLLHKK